MNPTPPNWPRISSSLYYLDASAAIDWLCKAFDFEVQLRIEGEGGRIEHSELRYGDGLVMVSSADKLDASALRRSPKQIDNFNTQNMMVYVDDIEAHCEQTRAAGGTIVKEPTTTDYGEEYWTDRSYMAQDPEGHRWWFSQRLRNPGAKKA
jgi:uncharacterized glyoxalase superfamily protein PhnB